MVAAPAKTLALCEGCKHHELLCRELAALCFHRIHRVTHRYRLVVLASERRSIEWDEVKLYDKEGLHTPAYSEQ